MTLSRYQTLSGHVLDLDLSPAEDAFLADLRVRVADPTTSLGDIVDRAYSDQNPMLAAAPVPGRGWVTPEIHARPAYMALLDIIQHKTLAQTAGELDGSEAYNVPTSEAAELLGISEVSVRRAISAGRLPGMKKQGRIYTTRAGVDAYTVSKRGPKAKGRTRRLDSEPLSIVHRGAKGYSLTFSADGDVAAGHSGGPTTVTGWSEVWVKTVDKSDGNQGKVRVVCLRPGPKDSTHGVGPLHVTGRFSVAQSAWGRAALELWKAREP